MNRIDFKLQRFAVIVNTTERRVVNGTADDDSIYNAYGYYATINAAPAMTPFKTASGVSR